MNLRERRRRVFVLAGVVFVFALQFAQITSWASAAAPPVAQHKIQGKDLGELVVAANRIKAAPRSTGAPTALPRTGDSLSPTISIALLLMLDGILMVWFARPKEQPL